MPMYLSPGVYVEELELDEFPPASARLPGGRGIRTTRTRWMAEHGTAAFLGPAATGPLDEAVEVTSLDGFEAAYGRPAWGAAVAGFFANGGRRCHVLRTHSPRIDAYQDALTVLERVPDVSVVAAPGLALMQAHELLDGEALAAGQLCLISHCVMMGDRVSVLDTPARLSAPQVYEWRHATSYDSSFAALFWPWVRTEVAGGPVMMPPSGHVAGLMARLDAQYGPHRSPVNEALSGVDGVETGITPGELDLLNPSGINGLADVSAEDARVRGMRTLTSDPRWRTLPSRRLMALVARNLRTRTGWALSAGPDDQRVWAQLEQDVSSLLRVLWQGGALAGTTSDDAFFARCDHETNRRQQDEQPNVIRLTGGVRLTVTGCVGFDVKWVCH